MALIVRTLCDVDIPDDLVSNDAYIYGKLTSTRLGGYLPCAIDIPDGARDVSKDSYIYGKVRQINYSGVVVDTINIYYKEVY